MAALNSTQYNEGDGIMPGAGPAGDLKVLLGELNIAAAQSANDTVNFFTAPAGFTPVMGWLLGADIDTGTEAYELDIGTSSDADQFLNSGVITGDAVTGIKPEAGIYLPLGNTLRSSAWSAFTEDTDIIGTVVAAPNAGGTGRLKLVMIGVYNDGRIA